MSTGGEAANALVCKTSIHGFKSRSVLQYFEQDEAALVGAASFAALSYFPVGHETGAAWVGGAAVQGLGRSGGATPAGSMNSATGVTGPLLAKRARAGLAGRGEGGGGMVAAEQRGSIWSVLARE